MSSSLDRIKVRPVSATGWVVRIVGILAVLTQLQAGAQSEPDHTTYIVRTTNNDPATLDAIVAAGGVIDHFDGHGARAYILHTHWATFLAANIPHTIESMQPDPDKQIDAYPSYAELGNYLDDIAGANSSICQLTSIGRSVQGREIWALQITDQPGVEEDEPEFAYLSTMHGDETVGTVLCLNFIDLLIEGYGRDEAITTLINETEIWIMPLINPDGYELGIRWNANNADLNRVFPRWSTDFTGTIASEGAPDTTGRQAEVIRIMDWTVTHSPVLMANYHTGALVVNYPYDEDPGIPSGSDAPSPDDLLMENISAAYADRNPPMLANRAFPGGITNGSAWYSNMGGMQDWHYRFMGAIHVTLEVSNTKNPSESVLADRWDDNRDAMMAYLNFIHRGVRGRITDRATGEPVFATVTVDDNPQPVFSDPDVGDYYRILLPGTYRVRAQAPGYIPYTTNLSVGVGNALRADMGLSKGDLDGNGRVDAVDLQLLINAILGRADNPDADVDGNGLSATDLQHLVNRVLARR